MGQHMQLEVISLMELPLLLSPSPKCSHFSFYFPFPTFELTWNNKACTEWHHRFILCKASGIIEDQCHISKVTE